MRWVNNGLAVVLVIGGCLALWAAGKAAMLAGARIFTEVIIPMKTSALEHLKNTDNMMKMNEETNKQIAAELRALNTSVSGVVTDVVEIKRTVSRVNCVHNNQ